METRGRLGARRHRRTGGRARSMGPGVTMETRGGPRTGCHHRTRRTGRRGHPLGPGVDMETRGHRGNWGRMETWGRCGTRARRRHETRRWGCRVEAGNRGRSQPPGRGRHETGGWGSPVETRAGCYETRSRGRPTEPGPGAAMELTAPVEPAATMAVSGSGRGHGCCETKGGDHRHDDRLPSHLRAPLD